MKKLENGLRGIRIYMSSDGNFVLWLSRQIEDRGWTRAEFARRASVTPAAVTLVLSHKRDPGVDFCQGTAQALSITVEEVMREAGLLGGNVNIRIIKRLTEIMSYLPPSEWDSVIQFAEWRLAESQKSSNGN